MWYIVGNDQRCATTTELWLATKHWGEWHAAQRTGCIQGGVYHYYWRTSYHPSQGTFWICKLSEDWLFDRLRAGFKSGYITKDEYAFTLRENQAASNEMKSVARERFKEFMKRNRRRSWLRWHLCTGERKEGGSCRVACYLMLLIKIRRSFGVVIAELGCPRRQCSIAMRIVKRWVYNKL